MVVYIDIPKEFMKKLIINLVKNNKCISKIKNTKIQGYNIIIVP